MKNLFRITKTKIILTVILAVFVWLDMNHTNIPVLFYHRINNIDNPEEGLCIPPDVFEMQLKWLKSHGYNSVSCKELDTYYNHSGRLPENPVMITFDDGYADNYLYAYPLLKKYGMKAVIFVETSRIGNSPEGRSSDFKILPYDNANYEAAKSLLAGLPSDQFVSWEECREMTKSGVIEIASHSHFHQELFTSDNVEEFYTSFDHWSTILATTGDERPGIPLFKRTSSMTARKFNDNLKIRDNMAQYYSPDMNSETLREKYNELISADSPGIFETPQEQTDRIHYEFSQSRLLIEKNCGATQAFCWPWGKYSGSSLKIGTECGYTLFFTTRTGTNTIHDSPYDICRFKIFSTSQLWFASRMTLHSHYALIKPYALLHNFSRGGYK